MNRPDFKVNYHKSKKYTAGKVLALIEHYPKRYSTPKYLTFMRDMIARGWNVTMYVSQKSKYIYIKKDDHFFNVRFSNHKPIYERQLNGDCDFFVGVSHGVCQTTEQVINQIEELCATSK
jgi:hypothetical protein